jgi:hypothetical protein
MNWTRPYLVRADRVHWLLIGMMAFALLLALVSRLAGSF